MVNEVAILKPWPNDHDAFSQWILALYALMGLSSASVMICAYAHILAYADV